MNRDQSLDALRGFAILAMVLSGAIAYGGILPAWMYHAQVPPPRHVFVPTLPGITWVDLVFPFFLFSMGAAIPLALQKLNGTTKKQFNKVLFTAARRYILLTFFAFFTYHMKPFVIAATPGIEAYCLSLLAFVLLFFQLYDYRGENYRRAFLIARIIAFALAFLLLWLLPFNGGKGFLFSKVDIIILVLGNVAFFGTLAWWFTRRAPLARWAILPVVAAVFLAGKEGSSWTGWLYHFTPLPWMYKFYYLKYLFLIIPGTFAGEWMIREKEERENEKKGGEGISVGLLALLLVITNVIFLFSRMQVVNLVVSLSVLAIMYWLLTKKDVQQGKLFRFWRAGSYLLLVGLALENYEGGIKKDPSTYSYYFVTAGLAFFMLIGLSSIERWKLGASINNFLALNGRNPLVAYVAGALVVMPLLHLTGIYPFYEQLNGTALTGFLKGVLFTAVVSLITIFFTRKGWFWKT